nr:sigma-70 family RNA polymerase sigma factor [uncultured Oscillibacter sp.]
MFDTKSDFALNKFDKDAIVCPSATGVHIRLTREDFANEEEFLRWKVWSDGDYHDIEKAGRGYYDYCLSLSEAGTTGISAEDIFIAPLLEAEQEERRAALLRQVKGLLTKTQYRRLWMYCVEGMNETRIAEAEHVGQPRICRSLRRAIKILEKNFPGRAKTGDKNG